MTEPARPPRHVLNPVNAVLAWLWPGLGQIARGERKRGLLIMAGVLFLFFSGLLVGGVDSVDRRNDGLWFLAQGLNGPIAFAADLLNQRFVQRTGDDWRSDRTLQERFVAGDEVLLDQLRRIGLGHVNEMGTLFIALAGLMNLVVILDALYVTVDASTGEVIRGGAV
ncbi:MAG: hypothetical protein GY715_11615 [Planctomycetes bacterium]|nr:hypothetical protein [Planctomycetota bacterium]